MIHSTFTAELHCQHGRVGVVDTPIYAHPLFSLDQDGWLCTEDQRGDSPSFMPVTFEFRFVKQSGDRIYYTIHGADTWEYFGSRLQKNDNGWLGLYASHILGRITGWSPPAIFGLALSGQQQWKIQTLDAWDGNLDNIEDIHFYLRDSEGHRVALAKDIYTRENIKYHHWFLNAGDKEGEILLFTPKNIKLI